jgi:hypothetical protein
VRKVVHYMGIGVLAAALYVGWVFASRWLSNHPGKPAAPEAAGTDVPDTRLKISQFYVSPPAVMEGERSLLCYGVENAKSVRIEPAVDGVWPSPNRCVEIRPQRTTKYKFIAESAGGQVQTASLEIIVEADPALLPKVVYLTAGPAKPSAAEMKAGGSGVWSICFLVRNAAEVSVDPPVVPPTSAPNGCFYDKPAKTTTYTLTARDAKGRKASKQVTVKVPAAEPGGIAHRP